jgi:hypothetical protein
MTAARFRGDDEINPQTLWTVPFLALKYAEIQAVIMSPSPQWLTPPDGAS